MTPQEFKAWFDGFTEAIEKVPTQKQWGRIKARVAEIDGTPITYPVYIDRYVAPYPYLRPYYPYIYPYTNTNSWSYCSNIGQSTYDTANVTVFDSCSAMNALGRAEGTGV